MIPHIAIAETIELSDKSIVVAKIIERTDHDITVNRDGMKMTYLLDEIISIDDDLDQRIDKLLKGRGYAPDTWPALKKELKELLIKIDFISLKNIIRQTQANPQELRHDIDHLGKLIKRQGCLNLQHPHPLISLLVNSLGGGRYSYCD